MNALRRFSDAFPRFLPLLLLLSVLLWFFATGGRQIFVKEVLGGAYVSQAEHFLRGNVDVGAEAIGHEAMIVNDHVRMYCYTPDLYSFLIFFSFLTAGGMAVHRIRYLLIGLVGISILVNLLATAFWLASDPNLPAETHIFWGTIAGMR